MDLKTTRTRLSIFLFSQVLSDRPGSPPRHPPFRFSLRKAASGLHSFPSYVYQPRSKSTKVSRGGPADSLISKDQETTTNCGAWSVTFSTIFAQCSSYPQGLTPEMFWAHRTRLRAADRADIPTLVAEIVASQSTVSAVQNPASPVLHVNGRLLLAAIKELPPPSQSGDVRYIILTPSNEEDSQPMDTHIYIPTVSGKKGQSHFLQTILPLSVDVISRALQEGHNVCVACESGKDMSVGVVLAALQQYFGDDGSYILSNSNSAGRLSSFFGNANN